MTLLELINFHADSRLQGIDARTKFLMVLYFLVSSIFLKTLLLLILNLIWVFLLLIYYNDIRFSIQQIWNLRILIILIPLVFWIAGLREISIILIVLVRLLLVVLPFQLLNNSTSPDELINALIQLRVPPKFAWMVGTTLRQAIFIIEDTEEVMDIQAIRRRYEQPKRDSIFQKFKDQVQRILPLMQVSLTRAIMNAREMGDMLYIRGWKGAHREITLYTSSIKRSDINFLILSTIFPFLATIIILIMKII